MIPQLDAVETRVLGCLIEKEITTPEYYPLTLNALVNACNQKSNRDPLVSFDEDTVQEALDRLREKKLSSVLTGGGNRVPKFGHRLQETLNLGRRELALMCELMIRGPQTPGELRDRAGRMHKFSDIEEVDSCLRALADKGMTVKLARQPGTKEARHAHLLSGEPVINEGVAEPVRVPSGTEARIATLEAEVSELKSQIRDMEQQWLRFKQQFD